METIQKLTAARPSEVGPVDRARRRSWAPVAGTASLVVWILTLIGCQIVMATYPFIAAKYLHNLSDTWPPLTRLGIFLAYAARSWWGGFVSLAVAGGSIALLMKFKRSWLTAFGFLLLSSGLVAAVWFSAIQLLQSLPFDLPA